MFRSLRPKPLEPLPLPFRNRRAEREAARRRAMERFANVELDRAGGFSWNRGPERVSLRERLRRLATRQLPFLAVATLMGGALVGAFLALSRAGLMTPGPTIIYIEDWSGRPDLSAPVPGRKAPPAPPADEGSGPAADRGAPAETAAPPA